FGCASVVESADVLRYLLSPLRPSHVLDTWTPYEISCFEVGITQLGKQFHAIQRYLIPTKSTRDVVLFYYMWKKHGLDKAEWADKDAAHDHFGLKRMKHERNLHGILPTAFDLMSDEDDSTTLAVKRALSTQSSLLTQQPRPKRAAAGAGLSTNPSATHPNLVKLAALRTDGTKLFSTLRALYDSSTDDHHHTSPTGELRLPRGIVATAPLRSAARPPHLLASLFQVDSWTAWELSVFENGLDVYGKHFDYVAALLPRKATSDVIALYYLWKKFSPTVYRRMKAAWPASPFGKVIDPPLSSSSPPPLLSDDEATAPLSTFHNATPHT
ncbi:hypothetical protein AaE_000752, partial [Aphanomyces astaci]